MAALPSTNEETEAMKRQHLLDLILFKKEAKQKIDELEASLRTLKPASIKMDLSEMVEYTKKLHSHYSLRNGEDKENVNLAQIAMWNNELINVVDKLQKALHNLDRTAREREASLTREIEKQVSENAKLIQENEALKARVASSVLQRRCANRIELAAEKIKKAEQLRRAGLRRLEYMEEALMAAHDDVYHVQRFDAVDTPQRDVCFVFHYISNLSFPLQGAEETWINVCKVLMFQCQKNQGGHYLGFYRGMQVFVFQDPLMALQFAGNCHVQLLQFRPPERESLPHFRTISDNTGSTVLYRGPRIHTCIFSCTPEVTVDPVNGKSSYFGPEVRASVAAAFQFSPVGEIVANKRWAQLVCRQQRYMTDSNAVVKADAADVRESLGRDMWDVAEMPGAGGIVCSILPKKLQGRRSIDYHLLHPSPRFPCMDIDLSEGIAGVVRSLKKSNTTQSKNSSSSREQPWCATSSNLSLEEGSMDSDSLLSGPLLMMQYFLMRQKKERITSLYLDLQKSLEYYERDLMTREDRYEISSRSPPDPSETVYVCTIDFGNDAFWKSLIVPTMTTEEYMSLRTSIRSYIHSQGKLYYGFLMNGNDVDIFTYAFREVGCAFSFVSDVYIMVNRHGTKCSHVTQGSGQDVCFLRAGITNGPMSSIYRVKGSHGSQSVKCTGPMIRLSAALCDLAHDGEILSTEDVISTFLSSNENLLNAQFNIVRQGGQFLYSSASSTAIHSILPKPFAYRRNHLREIGKDGRHPSQSVVKALASYRTEYSKVMVESLLNQQLERLEKVEAALMSAEDSGDYFNHDLRNSWLVSSQATSLKPSEGIPPNPPSSAPPLAFMYCNVRNTSLLEKILAPSVLQTAYGKYNFFVQKIIGDMGGWVAKTNGITAYMVVFRFTYKALEAALALQKVLSDSWWPTEMTTAEPCLTVKNPKTGALVFHGPRVQVSIHTTGDYVWKRIPEVTQHSPIDISGCGLDELYYLGCQTNGGEIRLSRQCFEHMNSVSAKLLLHQVVMEELPQTNISNLSSLRTPTYLSNETSSFKNIRGRFLSSSSVLAKSFHSKTPATAVVSGSGVLPNTLGALGGSSLTVTLEAFSAVPFSLAERLDFFLPSTSSATPRKRHSKVPSNSSLHSSQHSFSGKQTLLQSSVDEKGKEVEGGGRDEESASIRHHSLPLLAKVHPTSPLSSSNTTHSACSLDEESSKENRVNSVPQRSTPVPAVRRRMRGKDGDKATGMGVNNDSSSTSSYGPRPKSRGAHHENVMVPQSNAQTPIIPVLPAAPFFPAEKDNWYFGIEGSLKPLPPTRDGQSSRRKSSVSSGSTSLRGSSPFECARSVIPAEARDIQAAAERLLHKFPPELASTWDSNATLRSWPPLATPYLNFMRLSREIVFHLVRSFTLVNDKAKLPPFPKICFPKNSSQKTMLQQASSLPSLSSGNHQGIPSSSLGKSQRAQKNVCSNALDYLDEALKFLIKLQSLP